MPHKICNFDCIYCQLGKTKEKAVERKEYIDIQEAVDELKGWIKGNPDKAASLKYVAICGSGEPTLHTKIGELIHAVRQTTPASVVVITNASLVSLPELRKEISGADIIIPSLDAIDTAIFQEIDRPGAHIRLMDIINGLIKLRQEFQGKIWLEVMLVRGVNDGLPHIRRLKSIIEKIRPDKIQLNSPVRATTEKGVFPPTANKLKKIKQLLGEKAEIL